MYAWRKFSIFLLAFASAGCVHLTQNISLGEAGHIRQGQGVVLGTITLQRKTQKTPLFRYTSLDGKISGTFYHELRGEGPRIEGRFASLFAVELPAGEYVINQISFRSGGSLGGGAFIDTSDSSTHQVRFKVLAGKRNYLGDLLVDNEGSYMRGVSINGMTVRDMFAADQAHFIELLPELKRGDFEKQYFDVR